MAIQVVRNVDETQAVTTAEMKNYLKANYGTDTTEDALLVDFIFSAQRFLEDLGQFSISSKTWKCWVDGKLDLKKLVLPMGPIISIQKVYRIDDEGTETELTLNTDYYKKGLTDLVLFFTSTPSDGIPRGTNLNWYPIRVEYTAGHETVPDDLKIAVMKMTAENYMKRGDSALAQVFTIPILSTDLIAPYRKRRLF